QRDIAKAEWAEKWGKVLKSALHDIEKIFASRCTEFESGQNGLQFYHAQAIRAHLEMMVKGRGSVDASGRASEALGFSPKWGARLVRRWTSAWLNKRELPKSRRGHHRKAFSLLEDPTVRAELRSYLRSNKWAINPKKLQDFTEKKMIPDEAKKYLENMVNEEMPRGLKQYMEVELFPRIHMKSHKGISLPNDGQMKSWVLDGEQPLKKKGVGRGIHQSDVICSTYSWIEEASQSMEYGKNYEGYWDGELFVKQLSEKIIPAFERLHGPEYQALIMVDNSQGHSAYAKDALLAHQMNWRPSGKQASMRDGWFMRDGVRVVQKMTFPATHAQFPNQPKEFFWGAVKRYLRENCDYTFQTLKDNMPKALKSVELSTIRKWEHRMVRWMAAYRSGLEAKAAQIEVKKFSSRRFASHRRVPETVARSFD
ncbi:hypothetical protein IW261DRAFT_1346539, partial [Armillaria novae-zelandiae]